MSHSGPHKNTQARGSAITKFSLARNQQHIVHYQSLRQQIC